MSGFCVLMLRKVQEGCIGADNGKVPRFSREQVTKIQGFPSLSLKIIFPAASKSVGQITYARLQAVTGYFNNSRCTAYCVSDIFFSLFFFSTEKQHVAFL